MKTIDTMLSGFRRSTACQMRNALNDCIVVMVAFGRDSVVALQ